MTENRWLLAWGLGSVAVGAASLLVPLYVVRLGGNSFELGLLGAVAAALGAPGSLVWGRLADRTRDPRRVVSASLAAVGGLLAAMPLLSSIPALIVLNALLWAAFAAAGPVLTLLVVAEVSEAQWNRQLALLNKYQGYGWAGGLLLGIVWSATAGTVLSAAATQRSLFLACGGAAALAALLLRRWMPSPTDRQRGAIDPRRVSRRLSIGRRGIRGSVFHFDPNRLYWSTRNIRPERLIERFTPTLAAYYLAVGLFFSGFAAFFAPLPLYLTGVGFDSDLVFGLYLVSSLGSAAFYTTAGALSSRIDLRVLQSGAVGVRGLLLPLVAVAGAGVTAGLAGAALTGLLLLGIGLAWAVIAVTASAIVTRIAPQSVRGEALGMYAALSTLAGGVGSIAGGALADALGFLIAFAAAGVVVFAGAGLVLGLRGISARTEMTLDGTAHADRGAGPALSED